MEEDKADPVEPPLVRKASKEKKCKAEEVHELGEASSSSAKRKRKENMCDELARFGDVIDEDISQTEPERKNLKKLTARRRATPCGVRPADEPEPLARARGRCAR